jgi:hypothetical protein
MCGHDTLPVLCSPPEAAIAAIGAIGGVWDIIHVAIENNTRALLEDKWYYVWAPPRNAKSTFSDLSPYQPHLRAERVPDGNTNPSTGEVKLPWATLMLVTRPEFGGYTRTPTSRHYRNPERGGPTIARLR